MKKEKYLTPEASEIPILPETNFLQTTIPGSTGEDLDDPDPFDPFS